jgi:hypothetical protein
MKKLHVILATLALTVAAAGYAATDAPAQSAKAPDCGKGGACCKDAGCKHCCCTGGSCCHA